MFVSFDVGFDVRSKPRLRRANGHLIPFSLSGCLADATRSHQHCILPPEISGCLGVGTAREEERESKRVKVALSLSTH